MLRNFSKEKPNARPRFHFTADRHFISILSAPSFKASHKRLIASHGQRRIWAAEQWDNGQNAQTVPLAYRIVGQVDIAGLDRAIRTVAANNEALSTGLVLEHSLLARKRVTNHAKLEFHDASGLSLDETVQAVERKSLDFLGRRFDLVNGPMIRALLIKESSKRYILLVSFHHSAIDGESIDIVQKQIGEIYRGAPEEEVFAITRPFSQYVERIETLESTANFEKTLDKMIEEFSSETTVFSKTFRTQEVPTPHPRFVRHYFDDSIRASIDAKSAQILGHGSTALYLSAFGILMTTWFNRSRTIIGFPVANRIEAGDENIVGFMSNIVPIKLDFEQSRTLTDCLKTTTQALFNLRHRLGICYGLYLKRLMDDPFRFEQQTFDALLTYQPPKKFPLNLAGCDVSIEEPATWPVPYELMLDIEHHGDDVSSLFRWDAAKYSKETVMVLSKQFSSLIGHLCENGDLDLGHIREQLAQRFHLAEQNTIANATQMRMQRLSRLQIGSERGT